MKCPYCCSTVDTDALVCPTCSRELFLVKSLQDRIALLESELAEIRGQASLPSGIAAPASTDGLPSIETEQPSEEVSKVSPSEAARLWLTPVALLLVAHAFITIVYDLNPIWLRLVSLLIPLPFGYWLTSRANRPVAPWLPAAFLMSLLAVFGMSLTTAWIDDVSVFPQDPREWREFIEYAISVGFSSITGMLIGRMVWRRHTANRQAMEIRGLALRLAQIINSGQENAEKIQTTVKKIKELNTTITAFATSAASSYIGFRSFFGGD